MPASPKFNAQIHLLRKIRPGKPLSSRTLSLFWTLFTRAPQCADRPLSAGGVLSRYSHLRGQLALAFKIEDGLVLGSGITLLGETPAPAQEATCLRVLAAVESEIV